MAYTLKYSQPIRSLFLCNSHTLFTLKQVWFSNSLTNELSFLYDEVIYLHFLPHYPLHLTLALKIHSTLWWNPYNLNSSKFSFQCSFTQQAHIQDFSICKAQSIQLLTSNHQVLLYETFHLHLTFFIIFMEKENQILMSD